MRIRNLCKAPRLTPLEIDNEASLHSVARYNRELTRPEMTAETLDSVSLSISDISARADCCRKCEDADPTRTELLSAKRPITDLTGVNLTDEYRHNTACPDGSSNDGSSAFTQKRWGFSMLKRQGEKLIQPHLCNG